MFGYDMVAYTSLTDAGAVVQHFGARTVWAVLALDGNRYYTFSSKGNSPLNPDNLAAGKLTIADQIMAHAALQADGHLLKPSKVARLETRGPLQTGVCIDPDAQTRMRSLIQDEMFNRGITPTAHAEEFVIAGWKECVAEYKRVRGKAPMRAEVFVSFSPCREGDPLPSAKRTIDGIDYPRSCRNKLYTFFVINKSVKWSVYYDQRFRTAGPVGDDGMPNLFPGWTIRRMNASERGALGL